MMNNYVKILALISAMIIICCQAIGAAPGLKQSDSAMVQKCKTDLAKRLKLQPESIKVAKTESVVWPNSSMGMPESGKMYAQVLTPGLRIILDAKSRKYIYTSSARSFKYGGPVDTWACSMLYTKPVKNEPNLNSDLYQCSLIGTNNVRLISGVSEFYPQTGGVILAARRTSRSSYDLLYFKAGQKGEAKIIHSAFYIGPAATNDKNTQWAAFTRPMIGTSWMLTVDRIVKNDEEAKTIALPDDVMPDSIAWKGDDIMILVKKDNNTFCYSTSTKTGMTEWKSASQYEFPGAIDLILNKSESLEIEAVKEGDKPGVEVARVWFTGDRNVVAKINNLNLKGYDFLMSSFVVLWGERDSGTFAYTVDIATGEIIPGAKGIGENVKAFLFHPATTPFMK